MKRVSSWWAAAVFAGLCGALAASAALFASQAFGQSRRLEMAGDRFLVAPLARGVFEPETAPDGTTYAWTADVMKLTLPGLDRSGAWTVSLRARSAAIDPATEVVALVDGVIVGHWPADGRLATSEFRIPRSSRPGAVVTVVAPGASGGPNDPRVMGLLVDRITLSPDRWFVQPPRDALGAAAALGFSAGAAIALLGVPAIGGGVLLVSFACASAWLLSIGLTPFVGGYLRVATGLAVAILGGGAITRTVTRRAPVSPEARALSGIVVIAAATKALILLHPAVFIGDIGFHVHRLEAVRGGQWLFTSSGPGGEFPYPVALYAAATGLRDLTTNSDLLLRLLTLGADTAAAVVMYLVGSRAWESRRAALFAATLFIIAKATFHTQVVAFLTNGFGESLATLALLSLAAAATAPAALAIGGTASASLAAMLSHVSTAVLLAASLAASVAAQWYRATAATRRVALVGAASLALSCTAAYGIYYRHFTELYGRHLTTTAARTDQVPVPRVEAHQTSWAPGAAALRARVAAVPGYVQRYYGWPPLLLAAIGVFHLSRRTDALSRLTLARLAVCATFLVVGVVTPLDLRYYLAGAAGVALAAGFGAALGASSPNWLISVACSVLLVWCVVENTLYWFRWFS
jgi:hypothetical protein